MLQSIVTVLDSFEYKDWSSVCLEPTDSSEKVDIRWTYPDGQIKVVQVKSSQNEITYTKAIRWLNELKRSQVASAYELILIGYVDKQIHEEKSIEGTEVKVYPLDFKLLRDSSITSINRFFEERSRPKVPINIIEILLSSLNYELSENSIFGKEISYEEFVEKMVGWMKNIENHAAENPLLKYLPLVENPEILLKDKIVSNFLNLIGWHSYSRDQGVEYFDEKTVNNDVARVDYYLELESKLKDKFTNHIFINAIHDYRYPDKGRHEIISFLNQTNRITTHFQNTGKISSEKPYSVFNMLFWFADDNSEDTTDFLSKMHSDFRYEFLASDQQYFLVDNNKANFIISAIATARGYRQELPVKFLYPITEFNSAYDKIGKREAQLPPEYINTNILPIIKEDSEKISVLLFCADKFDKEGLKRLIWFLIKLTSGLSNEYIIYFPDYTADNKWQVDEVIRSFNNDDIQRKIKVEKFLYNIAPSQLGDVHLTSTDANKSIVKDVQGNEEVKINPVFREQLPYGDILKPILATDTISASDLKLFLNLKGIFLKNADKRKLIDLMVSLLFSPEELMEFVNLINVKERPINSVPSFIPLKSDLSIKDIFLRINPNYTNLTDGLQAKLKDPVIFFEDPNEPGTFFFSSYIEKKDLTKQVTVNTSWDRIRISYRKDRDKLVINTVETNSKDGKNVAKRIVDAIAKELLEKNLSKDEAITISFSDFETNRERVNFLLNFTDIRSTQYFIGQDIKSLKFIFDDNKDIPEEYKDKTEKDLIILFRGKNLVGLKELSEDFFKEIILLEELSIAYKFDINGVIGYYTVKYNFSEALKVKPIPDGEFVSQPYLHLSYYVKQKVKNIPKLEKELSKEIEDLKIMLYRKFNKI